MITNEQIQKHIRSLLPHTATVARRNHKYRVPIILDNHSDIDHLSTHDEKYNIKTSVTKKHANINLVDKYRFDGKWFTYHESIDYPEETFSILKVEDLFVTSLYNSVNKKSFVGKMDRLVFQGIMKPFMLFIDYKFVNWDKIEVVYDCDDFWIILRGKKYSYSSMLAGDYDIHLVILPYQCEYFGEEPDWLFDVNYKALNAYLQDSVGKHNDDDRIFIKSPTLSGEFNYKGSMFNVGGWLYSQIKKFNLGTLSRDRINRLRNISLYNYTYDGYGNIISSTGMRFNALDKDIVTNRDIYNELCLRTMEDYETYPSFKFDDNGLFNMNNGNHIIRLMDKKIIFKQKISSEDKILYDLSDISNMLFRENYLIFKDGLIDPEYPIMGSLNNLTFCDNPDENIIAINVLYHEDTDHVIRNTDNFRKSYINEQARMYLEILYHTNYTKRVAVDAIDMDSHRIYPNIDAVNMVSTGGSVSANESVVMLTPNGDSIEILKRSIVEAREIDNPKSMQETGTIFKELEAYYLDIDFAFIPKLTDYIVYINGRGTAITDFIKLSLEPLDYDFANNRSYSDNVKNALDSIVAYNPALLNPLYHTFTESRTFTGAQANESLIYSFMYEDKRGLKIPRKRYRDHESYFMIFINGELCKDYYRTIAYTNFFFIPMDEDFEFELTDRIEVIYFKNVNNNEIRFYMNPRLLQTFIDSNENNDFYVTSDIFKPYIRPKELKIFSHYPKNILHYPTLIPEPSENIAFNISYRDNDNNVCLRKFALEGMDISDSEVTGDKPIEIIYNTAEESLDKSFVAVSKHKFIYQRLFVEHKSYRIKLDKRFRYCDNQSQYLLFVNGRRMKQDSFLITIPKHTRPFNDLYLYTARFVGSEDRVELFYLPYDMSDLNNEYDIKYTLKSNGYLEFNKRDLKVPFDKNLYLFFVNGKKIPSTDIVNIDSSTVRVSVNTNTLKYVSVTNVSVDSIPEVEEYLKNDKLSKYDLLLNYIRTHSKDAYKDFNELFGIYTEITDNEEDKVWANVARIAILNEIVRDFWVTSGYPYQDQLFTYDYETDEYYEKKSDGTLILPALDADPEINIKKNDISLVYFYTDPLNLLFEIGDSADAFSFFWEYSQRLNQGWKIISQSINDKELDVNAREYEWVEHIEKPTEFTFKAKSGLNTLVAKTKLDFVNGIYWGVIDEDSLQYYQRITYIETFDRLIALMPKDGIMWWSDTLENWSSDVKYTTIVKEKADIVDDITYTNDHIYRANGASYIPEMVAVVPKSGEVLKISELESSSKDVPTVELTNYIYPLDDSSTNYNYDFSYIIEPKIREYTTTNGSNIRMYYDDNDLPDIIHRLDKHLVREPNIKLNDYLIGNNNYFVFACPKSVVYFKGYHNHAEFYFPDPNGEDIVEHCRDDKTTPIYTNGELNFNDKLLHKLYKMEMEYMGECKFTNDYGYTELYMVWKTNGFFTRLFENYGIDIHIKIGDFTKVTAEYINDIEKATVIDYNNTAVEVIPDRNAERTENMEDNDTNTIGGTTEANTVIDNSSFKKVGSGVISNTEDKEPEANTVDISSSANDEERVKELLEQGIFLI